MGSSTFSINLNVNVDINTLLDQVGKAAGIVLTRTGADDRSFNDGSRFVSIVTGSHVVSMYFNPSKWHTATADGGLLGGGVHKSRSAPGTWAVAYSSSGIGGRKTFYNNE